MEPGSSRVAPGPGFSTPLDLFIACVTDARRPDAFDLWWSFTSGERVVQVNAASVNTCLEPVDLAAMAEGMGLPGARERVRARMAGMFRKKPDLTLHDVSALSAEEVGALVDAVFAVGFRLDQAYTVRALIEG